MTSIDCSVMLSAPTLDAIFEPSDHVGDLSQNAVRRAFDPSSVMDESDHDVVIGTFQRLLSEAESDTHVGVSEEGNCEEVDPPNATTSVS
ncbi:hypothetical protein PC123_g26435 [Phytophthora cactorum]|nr:hypothetical protein PC123_g26435 [Phytophthora cactorum]